MRDQLLTYFPRATVRQYGALPYRRHPAGAYEVLLVTTCGGRRWIVPKGWPSIFLSPAHSAAREAREEAGVCGHVDRTPLGSFRHRKRLRSGSVADCEITVFPLAVTHELATWPDMHRRERCWVAPEDTALLVDSEDLVAAIRSLPQHLAGSDGEAQACPSVGDASADARDSRQTMPEQAADCAP